MGILSLSLISCASSGRFSNNKLTVTDAPKEALLTNDIPSSLIKDGAIRVGVVLPLNTKDGKMIKSALEYGVLELRNSKILLLIEDSSAVGARSAARSVIAKGAEVILGPISSSNTRNVGVEARSAGIPVISFSLDKNVAGNGVYLQSILLEEEIKKVVAYSASRGFKRFASLTPKGGKIAGLLSSSFKSAANRYGSLVASGTYKPLSSKSSSAARSEFIADVKAFAKRSKAANANAVFLPASPATNKNIVKVMQSVGYEASGVKFLGTSFWKRRGTSNIAKLSGGWYANAKALNSFTSRFSAYSGKTPTNNRPALAFDALSLVSQLGNAGDVGTRFTPTAFARSGGFGGVLGHYKYSYNGVSNYNLNIMQVSSGGARVVSSSSQFAGN